MLVKAIRLRALLTTTILSLGLTSVASAGSATGQIAEIAVNRNTGAMVYVRMAQAPISPPACSTNGYWHFTLTATSEADKRLYAMLLAAYLAGKAVTIDGTGGCSELSTIESAVVVRLQ